MYKSYSLELAGRTLTVDIGRVCAQAERLSVVLWNKCDSNRKFSDSNGFVCEFLR